MDTDIEPGVEWAAQIEEKLISAKAALCLVTENLLRSSYTIDKEMPIFEKRINEDCSFHLFWALLEPCNWQSCEGLQKVQAVDGITNVAISQCKTEADVQTRLIYIVETIARTMLESKAEISSGSLNAT